MNFQKQINPAKPVLLLLIATMLLTGCKEQKRKNYEPTWESLASHPVPHWFRDAKFGIFIHWGVYAVPAYHEWYIEFMSPKSNWVSLRRGLHILLRRAICLTVFLKRVSGKSKSISAG